MSKEIMRHEEDGSTDNTGQSETFPTELETARQRLAELEAEVRKLRLRVFGEEEGA